jgi:hypothetical protein
MIPVLERVKTVHALDRAATVISGKDIFPITNPHKKKSGNVKSGDWGGHDIGHD